MRIQAFRGAILALILCFIGVVGHAAPYAAMVMDARTGKVLHSRNADTRLYPASLTKMMTLYVIFEAVRRGELTMDTKFTISKNAAAEPPSKLGLRPGSKVSVRHLVRAAAVKSANDAATALAEGYAGSEARFAKHMTNMAKRLGMRRTTFKNAHGLTASGHLSTARDMTILGRRLMYDFPEYYNLFQRKSADTGKKTVLNTNRRLLGAYKGADGIKTGYTNASGFNLVASAERGEKRIIATVFGGKTSAARYAKVAQLLDLGFREAPSRYARNQPKPGRGRPAGINRRVASLDTPSKKKVKPKVIRAPRAVAKSPFPVQRPRQIVVASAEQIAIEKQIVAENKAKMEEAILASVVKKAKPKPAQVARASVSSEDVEIIKAIARDTQPTAKPAVARSNEPVVVTKASTTKGSWGIQLGAFPSRYQAEKVLLRTALADLNSLEQADGKVTQATVKGQRLFRARFVGINQASANKTCARLIARNVECIPVNLGG